jgi:hypothetical protein
VFLGAGGVAHDAAEIVGKYRTLLLLLLLLLLRLLLLLLLPCSV